MALLWTILFNLQSSWKTFSPCGCQRADSKRVSAPTIWFQGKKKIRSFGSSKLRAMMVGLTGLEPVTPRLSSVCSNQLSYRPLWIPWLVWSVSRSRDESWKMVEVNGFEPLTFCLQSRRSTNWAKPPFAGFWPEALLENFFLQQEEKRLNWTPRDFYADGILISVQVGGRHRPT